MQSNEAVSVSAALTRLLHQAIARNGGWLPFDRFMAMALYAPGLGYYAHGSRKFGGMPQSGSDFVTAPELSPLFGRALARQVAQALRACESLDVWEFGAGSGALAEHLLDALTGLEGIPVRRYSIVDLSGSLRERQRERLKRFGDTAQWVSELPETLQGVVVGNEVLDAMPVQLLYFDGHHWHERGVVTHEGRLAWGDRPTELRPPVAAAFVPGTVTELHAQAQAFVATVADRMTRGAAFFIDYGFPETEYYHPQRHGGTLMCHRAHQADGDPLADVGLKDITAHVNFTGVALAAQNAGFSVLGYTSQAHFLLNCGMLDLLETRQGQGPVDVRATAAVQKLVHEHEMGELFKVIGLAKGCTPDFTANPMGFAQGDRTHRL